MKVLLTGANGFIGRYILASLVEAGHQVVPAVRRPEETDRLLPAPASLHVDLNHDVDSEIWLPRLIGIDAVINCAGVLQGSAGQNIAAIHSLAPKALFEACICAGVRRVIQISAISVAAETEYARTKRSADEFLAVSSLDWVILRPSLVYAAGSYGGTALFRALAALPFFIPVPGNGEQGFQPINIRDVCSAILRVLQEPAINRVIIEPAGPDRLTMREILLDLRRWLGFKQAPIVQIPFWAVRIAVALGDIFGGTINGTAWRQLEFGNVAETHSFMAITGIRPDRWHDVLIAQPAQLQDRWHARLYFVRPLLRFAIALTWLWSGCAGILERHALEGRFTAFGLSLPQSVIWATCLLDVAIGAAVLLRWRVSLTTVVQITVVAAYTLAVTIAQASLWIEPFGSLLKNIPFIAAVLVLAAIERDR